MRLIPGFYRTVKTQHLDFSTPGLGAGVSFPSRQAGSPRDRDFSCWRPDCPCCRRCAPARLSARAQIARQSCAKLRHAGACHKRRATSGYPDQPTLAVMIRAPVSCRPRPPQRHLGRSAKRIGADIQTLADRLQ